MRYFPAYCESCHRSFLEPANVHGAERPEAAPNCPRCEQPGRLVPGAYYAEGDRQLFAAMESAIHEARLSPAQIAIVVGQLERIASGGEPSLARTRELVGRLTGLHRLESTLADETLSPFRVHGLLFSLFSPLAEGWSLHSSPAVSSAGGADAAVAEPLSGTG